MGLPGIFSTQAIRSFHVKGASMLGDTLLYQSSTRHRTIQKTKRPFKLKVWSSSNASLILSSAAKITYVFHIPSCLSLLKLIWFLLPWSFLRFCSKRCSKSIYFSREIIGNHGGWHPSFARNTNRFMGCICTWVYMTLKPWSLLGQRSKAKFQISRSHHGTLDCHGSRRPGDVASFGKENK